MSTNQPAFILQQARRCRERGSALLLVTWAVLLLLISVMGWAQYLQADLELDREASYEIEARALAHSGLAIGLHPQVTQSTPLLEQQTGEEAGYRVKLIGESGRMNINWILVDWDNTQSDLVKAKQALFIAWLERQGVGFRERDQIIDCLLDYVDGDNNRRLNGLEDDGDYHPANRQFLELDELQKVRGIEPLLASPGWREQLTVFTSGPINLLSATPELLGLIPGIGEMRVQRFVQIRRGPDQEDGTLDDYKFKNAEEIRSMLGFTAQQFQQLNGLVDAQKDSLWRITSEGRVGNVVRQIEVVAQKQGTNPAIRFWKE